MNGGARRAAVIYREAQRAQAEARGIIEAAEAEAEALRAAARGTELALRAEAASTQAAWEARLADVAVAVVRALLETELRARPDLVRALVRRALSLAADPDAQVFLHPADLDSIDGARADPSLPRGGCRVETGGAQVRCTPESLSEDLRGRWRGPR